MLSVKYKKIFLHFTFYILHFKFVIIKIIKKILIYIDRNFTRLCYSSAIWKIHCLRQVAWHLFSTLVIPRWVYNRSPSTKAWLVGNTSVAIAYYVLLISQVNFKCSVHFNTPNIKWIHANYLALLCLYRWDRESIVVAVEEAHHKYCKEKPARNTEKHQNTLTILFRTPTKAIHC